MKIIHIPVFLMLVVLVLDILYYDELQQLATVGTNVGELRVQTSSLRVQNLQIENEILEKESLLFIREWAKERGFIQGTFIYIGTISP